MLAVSLKLTLRSGELSLSCLLNLDWSIQISRRASPYARSSRHVVFVCGDFVRARKTAKRERDLKRIDVSKKHVWEREESASAGWMTFLGIICTPEKKYCAEREKAKVLVKPYSVTNFMILLYGDSLYVVSL